MYRMWKEADEGIRSRIRANVINSARVRMLVYLVLLLLSITSVFFLVYDKDSFFSSLVLCLILCFAAIGLISILYVYFTSVRKNTRIINEAAYMTVGLVVTRLGDSGQILVKLPGEKSKYKIDCDKEFFKNATSDARVLVIAVSKKNEDLMVGYDPATYDKDGIF